MQLDVVKELKITYTRLGFLEYKVLEIKRLLIAEAEKRTRKSVREGMIYTKDIVNIIEDIIGKPIVIENKKQVKK